MIILQFHTVRSIESRAPRLCSILESFGGLSGASLGAAWTHLGVSWVTLRFVGCLRVASWEPCGTHLGFSWVTFRSLGSPGGFLWATMGTFGLKLQSVLLFLEAPV